MRTDSLYERLAEHFNHFIVGAPRTDTLIAILRIMFPPDEAELALKMPVMHRMTLPELQAVQPAGGPGLQRMLGRMAARGTVQTFRRPGPGEDRYALLPSAKGWYDTPYWAGRETADGWRLAPLWLQYREEAFGAELARGDLAIFRTVPVGRALKHDAAILPFERLRPRIEAQSLSVVSHCPCRQIKNSVGQGCGHSLEVCFNFGSMARHLVDQGMGREVAVTETLEIVKACEEEGLVHCVENIDGYLGTLCNCCPCCCLFIDARKRLGFNALAPSAYVARAAADACTACGECRARCPMDAVALPAGGAAAVDPARCLGCGQCVAACGTEAMELVPRPKTDGPPDLQSFLERKLRPA
jgi:Pyruvate/2-oxoacid:ferredoxin oxidoreductase delta subunit